MWDERFLAMAQHVAEWSKDPSTKVGAVIVSPDRSEISIGYNGFPRGVNDDPNSYFDRELKLMQTVHAELNAILNAGHSLKGHTLYTTLAPCCHCAAAIIQAGIVRVVSIDVGGFHPTWMESIDSGRFMLLEVGVEYERKSPS